MNKNKLLLFLNIMRQNYLRIVVISLQLILCIGCVSPKKITYFQDENGKEMEQALINFEPTLQIGDILTINVSSIIPEAAVPFNIYENQR